MLKEDKFVWELFQKKFPEFSREAYEDFVEEYLSIKPFKASENIFETNQSISNEAHFIMRTLATKKLQEVFEILKIDLEDPNVKADFENGNLGTPGRVIKLMAGAGTDDDTECGSGRFMKPVRIATFPNKNAAKIPITKRINIASNCSHHLLPFNTDFDNDSYAIVSYIPKDYVLGISKLQRLADFVSRRYWLQEDLTKEIYNKIKEAAQTEDVYVKLCNIKHTCEWIRGARNTEGGFTSEFYGGAFEDPELRKQVQIRV